MNRAFHKTSRSLWLALLAGVSFALPAYAQSGPVDDTDIVVVTGTSVPVEREKIGNSLTVVVGDLIEDQGYSYVPDALRQVPGLAVSRTGPFGGLTQVRIRGAEGNHTLVLLDGIDISSPDQGETDFSTLLSGDLERIEVLRGPQSGLYGSNALAGVVNLISRRLVDGPYAYGGVEFGDMRTFQLQAGGGIGDGETYASAGMHVLVTDGFDVSPPTDGFGFPAVGQSGVGGDEEDNAVSTFHVRGGRAFSDAIRTDAFVRYVHKDAGTDGQAFSQPISGRSYDDAGRSRADLYLGAVSGTLSLENWETVATLSYQRDERRGLGASFPFTSPPALPPTPAQVAAVLLEANGADATRAKATIRSTYEFGLDGFVSYLSGFIEGKNETFKNACESVGAFCTAGQRPKQQRDLGGVGVEYRAEIDGQYFASATVRHNANSDFEDDTTWSVAGSWVIPNVGARLHASVGTGVTNPTFTEQFGFFPDNFQGNENLIPEDAEGYDIGIEQALLGGDLVFDLTWFSSTLKNEIVTLFPAPSFIATPANNPLESERSGIEASVRYTPIDGLDLIGSWTNLDATEPTGIGGAQRIEIRRPENQGALDATWRLSSIPLQLNLGVTYNGTQFDTGARAEQDPYTVIRAGASWRMDDETEFYARVENLTDEDYEEILGFGSMPRAVYVGVRLKTGNAG